MLWLISISEWVSEWLGNKKLKSKKTHRKLLFFISIWKFRIMLRHAYCKKNIETEFMPIVCLGKAKSWIWFQKLLFQNTLLSQCSVFFFILFFNEKFVHNGKFKDHFTDYAVFGKNWRPFRFHIWLNYIKHILKKEWFILSKIFFDSIDGENYYCSFLKK